MMKDSIKYNHWKTGKEIQRPLHNSEQRTTLICPLDKTPLIKYNEEMIKGYECPNCGIDYSKADNTQYGIEDYVRNYFRKIKDNLDNFHEDKNTLEAMLELARVRGVIE